jgi:hypothetical protein
MGHLVRAVYALGGFRAHVGDVRFEVVVPPRPAVTAWSAAHLMQAAEPGSEPGDGSDAQEHCPKSSSHEIFLLSGVVKKARARIQPTREAFALFGVERFVNFGERRRDRTAERREVFGVTGDYCVNSVAVEVFAAESVRDVAA